MSFYLINLSRTSRKSPCMPTHGMWRLCHLGWFLRSPRTTPERLNEAIHLKYTIQSNQISRGTFSIILVANLSILPKFSWAQFATHLNIFNVKNVIIGGDVREDLIKRAWKWGKPPPGTSWRAKNHSFNDFSFSLKIYWLKSISTYWLQKVCCSYKNHLIPYVYEYKNNLPSKMQIFVFKAAKHAWSICLKLVFILLNPQGIRILYNAHIEVCHKLLFLQFSKFWVRNCQHNIWWCYVMQLPA